MSEHVNLEEKKDDHVVYDISKCNTSQECITAGSCCITPAEVIHSWLVLHFEMSYTT